MRKFLISVEGNKYEVLVEEMDSNEIESTSMTQQPQVLETVSKPSPKEAAPEKKEASPKPMASGSVGTEKIMAPMPGTILKVLVSVGQTIKKNQTLCVLEAMKMENEIVASRDGVIASVNVAKGTSVNAGDMLLSLE